MVKVTKDLFDNYFLEQFFVFQNINKIKIKNTFDNKKTVFYFLFSRLENMVFLENIFLVVFTCFHLFFRAILKNNYINMYND